LVSLNLGATVRQKIRDATLPIQVLRAQVAPLVADGRADNEELVRRGVRMLSLDVTDLDDDVVDHLISRPEMPYHFAYGPLPIKVFDRRSVMLDGPSVPGATSIMVVSRPEFVAAAMHYVKAVREVAVPASEFAISAVEGLTHRQLAIARLLSEGHNDDHIAELLGLSVRTVRAEVAVLLQAFGTSTRFAASARYARATQPETAD
jgi:DNA-binding CsgD family transcriptional regulator